VAEDPRIEQIREVLANHTDPFSIYGHQGRGLERIRAIAHSAPPAPRVWFPGDTVPAGVAAMSAKGVCMAAATVPLAVDGLADPPYVEVPGAPTWEEWQAAVDRASEERAIPRTHRRAEPVSTTDLRDEPPTTLSGEDGESYIRVSEFTDEQIREAAATAINEWSLATEDIPEQAITRLASTAIKCRFREHNSDTEDCDCGGENGRSWWCEFGKGPSEGLYVQFEFGVAEEAMIEALSDQATREVSDGE
jgi:hypothetical protein